MNEEDKKRLVSLSWYRFNDGSPEMSYYLDRASTPSISREEYNACIEAMHEYLLNTYGEGYADYYQPGVVDPETIRLLYTIESDSTLYVYISKKDDENRFIRVSTIQLSADVPTESVVTYVLDTRLARPNKPYISPDVTQRLQGYARRGVVIGSAKGLDVFHSLFGSKIAEF